MSNCQTYQTVDLETLDYKKELNVNKMNGSKSVYCSTQKGSNDPQHRLRFQMAEYGGGDKEIMRAVYGVSTPLQGQPDSRRALDLSIDSDELLAFLMKLDARNKAAALENAQEWFKKPLTAAEVEAFYVPIVKQSTKAEYRPTARTKLIMDTGRNDSQLFMVTKETPAAGGAKARIDGYEPVGVNDIQKGCRTIPIVETNGLWFAQKSFGMSLVITHLLVWPKRQVSGIEAFMLPGGHPQWTPRNDVMRAPPSSFGHMEEEEMAVI